MRKRSTEGWLETEDSHSARQLTDFQPASDYVLVEVLDAPASKLIITPEQHKGAPVRGKVLAVGPGRTTSHGIVLYPDVFVGDIVQFHFGHLEYWPDEQHGLVPEAHIQAVIEK